GMVLVAARQQQEHAVSGERPTHEGSSDRHQGSIAAMIVGDTRGDCVRLLVSRSLRLRLWPRTRARLARPQRLSLTSSASLVATVLGEETKSSPTACTSARNHGTVPFAEGEGERGP